MKIALIQSLYSLISSVVFAVVATLHLLCIPVALIPGIGIKLSSHILVPARILLENLERIGDAFAEDVSK